MLEIVFFYIAATVALIATVMAMTRANAIHALIYLIVSLLAVAVIFFLIGAPFAAALEIVIYAGAIMVLFLFVIMMFDLRKNQPESKSNLTKLAGSVVAGSLLVVLIALVRQNNINTPPLEGFVSQTGMVENLGKVLYSEYLLPFELVSILFFVAMVGAVLLGKREAGERNF